MKTNIGSHDGAIRFVVGCLVGLWGLHVHSWWGLLGLIPVATVMVWFCPLYALFHIDTTQFDH